jgi:DNA-directed RNA polymerase specialized sigma24 family protein
MGDQVSDQALQDLLVRRPAQGWRVFVEQFTPVILGALQRAGLRDRDEMMEVYTLVVERLAANRSARLRSRRMAEGSLAAWLVVVTRHVVVDWVRSRAGRRRVFGAIKELSEADQRVFELYYWEERRVPEICGMLSAATGRDVPASEVLDGLERVNRALTARHHAELLSMSLRSRPAESIDDDDGALRVDAPAAEASPEEDVIRREREAVVERALAALPPEDAAVIRLHVGEGLALPQVRRALRLPSLTDQHVQAILDRVRQLLREANHDPSHAS